jgi:sugar lactone lactonase YvrE
MRTVEIFDDRRCRLGEGPHYDERTDRVWWVDILGRRLLWRVVGGTREPGGWPGTTDEAGEVHVDEHVGALVPDSSGGLVACLRSGPAAVKVAADGTAAVTRLAPMPVDPFGTPALRCNDAKVDPTGRLWLGTMAYDDTPHAGALYRLDPGAGTLRTMVDGVSVSNGLGWSPVEPIMYFIDTPTMRIDVFDYDAATGDISGRRRFVQLEGGHPDGLCVDAEGAVWVALWGGSAVRRYTPDGDLDRIVPVPTPFVTSCAFAGEDLATLVITTAAGQSEEDPAGRTYAYRPGDVAGLPVARFGQPSR